MVHRHGLNRSADSALASRESAHLHPPLSICILAEAPIDYFISDIISIRIDVKRIKVPAIKGRGCIRLRTRKIEPCPIYNYAYISSDRRGLCEVISIAGENIQIGQVGKRIFFLFMILIPEISPLKKI